ncbi:MAG: tRNA pseudouridine(55) synthase TruB [Patescibacteria group bacterium]
MEKIVVANKPRGQTSYQVVREFKRQYPGQKVGHAGTLDPLAEGVLIILIGKATKRQSEFMGLEKEYLVDLLFGKVSPSLDLEFEPEPYRVDDLGNRLKKLNRGAVEKALKQFEGEIDQVVPAFSAIKKDGQRLYKLARQQKVSVSDLPERKVMVKEIRLVDFVSGKWPTARISMRVSKGTYVRSIVRDLGESLGVGAVTTRLIRTRIGDFKIDPHTSENQ